MPRLVESHPNVGDQREMVRGDQAGACAGQGDLRDFDRAAEVDVVEVEDGEEAGIRAAASQVRIEVDALEFLREDVAHQSASPFVEIAEHDLRTVDAAVENPRRQLGRLKATFEKRRAEVRVVDMQDASLD